MIVNVDKKALEWRGIVYLSQDKVGMKEILEGLDQHSDNQERFKLPSRLIAKTFVFRLIYGGTAYAYANDPEFSGVSKQERFWQRAIDEFYDKYKGIANQHQAWMQEATRTGRIIIPTGRTYSYTPEKKRGEMVWPRTKILNYPVQGFSADLMMLARLSAYNRLKHLRKEGVLFVNTVHDSLMVDTPSKWVYNISTVLEDACRDVPANFEKIFDRPFNVPMAGEVEYGPSWGNMVKFNREEYGNCISGNEY